MQLINYLLILDSPTEVHGVAYLAKNKRGGLKVVVQVNYTAGKKFKKFCIINKAFVYIFSYGKHTFAKIKHSAWFSRKQSRV